MVISILHLKENHQKIPLWFWNDKGTGLFLKKKRETLSRQSREQAGLLHSWMGHLGNYTSDLIGKRACWLYLLCLLVLANIKMIQRITRGALAEKNLNELRTEQHRRGVFSCRTDWVCISQLSSAPVLCSRLLLLQLVATAVGSAALLTGIQIKTGVQQAHKENKKWNLTKKKR